MLQFRFCILSIAVVLIELIDQLLQGQPRLMTWGCDMQNPKETPECCEENKEQMYVSLDICLYLQAHVPSLLRGQSSAP